jgi:hypothetical protein
MRYFFQRPETARGDTCCCSPCLSNTALTCASVANWTAARCRLDGRSGCAKDFGWSAGSIRVDLATCICQSSSYSACPDLATCPCFPCPSIASDETSLEASEGNRRPECALANACSTPAECAVRYGQDWAESWDLRRRALEACEDL